MVGENDPFLRLPIPATTDITATATTLPVVVSTAATTMVTAAKLLVCAENGGEINPFLRLPISAKTDITPTTTTVRAK